MAWRFRARLLFPRQSGLATWARDQMAQRMTMAMHLREGTPREEQSHHEVTRQGNREWYTADLITPDDSRDLMRDSFATLTDASLTAQVLDPVDEDDDPSFVQLHECRHDVEPPEPCVLIDREWRHE